MAPLAAHPAHPRGPAPRALAARPSSRPAAAATRRGPPPAFAGAPSQPGRDRESAGRDDMLEAAEATARVAAEGASEAGDAAVAERAAELESQQVGGER